MKRRFAVILAAWVVVFGLCAFARAGWAQGMITGTDEIGFSLGVAAVQHPEQFATAMAAGVAFRGIVEVGFAVGRHTLEPIYYLPERRLSTRSFDVGFFHHLGATDRKPRVHDGGARVGLLNLWGDGVRSTTASLTLYRVDSKGRSRLAVPSVTGGVVNQNPGASYMFISGQLLIGAPLVGPTTLLFGPTLTIIRSRVVYGGSIQLVPVFRVVRGG